MSNEWYTPKELAGLPGLPDTVQAVNRRASRDGWECRPRLGRGGGREYALASLPVETQTALLVRQAPPKKKRNSVVPALDRESLWDTYERKPQAQKNEAARRLALVQRVERLTQAGIELSRAVVDVAHEITESRATLYRWLKTVRGADPSDWLALLAPQYSCGCDKTACTPEAWEFFKAQYLRPESPAIKTCWIWTRDVAKEQGWDWPALRTIQRWVNEKIPRSVRVLMREGEVAMLRMYPSQKRTVRDLYAMNWINGDGYQHNVFVKFPDGTIGRPKVWYWQDVYSRRLLAWRADRTEHSDMIRLALGDVIERFGIPEHATIDNTRAAANKWMTGGVKNRYRFKVREEDPFGLMPLLGIRIHWTSVHKGKGWGQAKPVERTFGVGGLGEYVDKRWEFRGAYTGPNVTAKPENYGSAAVDWNVFIKVLDQAIAEWNAREGRQTEICAGAGSFDTAFRESYERNAQRIRRATAAQRRMWLLAAEAVTVKSDGAVVLTVGTGPQGKNRYSCDALIQYTGSKVIARFDPDKLHTCVHVYQPDGRYIGEAECIHAAGFGDTSRGREWKRLKNERLRSIKQAAASELQMTEVTVSDLMPTAPEPLEPRPQQVVRGAFDRHQHRRVSGSDVIESPAERHNFADVMMRLSADWIRQHPGVIDRDD